MKRSSIFTLAVAITLVLIFAAAARAQEKPPQLWLNEPAPGFTLETAGGKKVSLKDFKNKNTVIVSFWHAQNPDSIPEYKELKKILKNKSFKDVKVLAITFGEETKQRDEAKKLFKEAGLDFTLLFEKRKNATTTNVHYQVSQVPAFYVINRKGELASPLLASVTDEVAGKTFADFLKDVVKGKKISGCAFVPERRYEDKKEYKKLYDLIGKKAPDFSARSDDGKKQAPAYYRGFKNVILVFWSPGCSHCRHELPLLQAYKEKWAEKQDVQILSVTRAADKDGRKVVKDFFGFTGIDFPAIYDEDGAISNSYSIRAVPVLFIIDKKGIVREIIVGSFGLTADVLHCMFEKMK